MLPEPNADEIGDGLTAEFKDTKQSETKNEFKDAKPLETMNEESDAFSPSTTNVGENTIINERAVICYSSTVTHPEEGPVSPSPPNTMNTTRTSST